MGNICEGGGWLVGDESQVQDSWGPHTCGASGPGLVGSQVRVAEIGCRSSMGTSTTVGERVMRGYARVNACSNVIHCRAVARGYASGYRCRNTFFPISVLRRAWSPEDSTLPICGPPLMLPSAPKRWGSPRGQGFCCHLAHLWPTSNFAPRSEAVGTPEAAGVI